MESDHSESFRALVRLPEKFQNAMNPSRGRKPASRSINLATPFFVVYMLERLMLPMRAVTALIVFQQLVHVLSIRGLDFIFLISAAAGLVAAQWLALISEPGQTRKIFWEFKEELSLPFRRSRSTAAFEENDLLGV
jgi:hypothetical protein